jgi:4a-hydroxytetrahydrobiopterin dehydratase
MAAMAEPLDTAALTHALSAMDGWHGDRTGIERTVELATFPQAIAFVDRVAVAAEEMNHHPDIDIRWRKVTLRLVTHSAGGYVTDKDLTLGHRIDSILRGL